MSSPPHPSPAEVRAAAANRDASRTRFRHFWEGPEESDDPKQGADHVSPVARLYRHALESVFGFLGLDDLSRVLSVSRSWSSAVRSMKPIGATLVMPRSCVLVAASPLARHVGQVGSHSDIRQRPSLSDSFLLSHHLGSLTALGCVVQLPQPSGLLFAPSLQTLNLRLEGDAGDVSAINDAIVAISQLPQLTNLTLELPKFFPELSFAPLKAASKLHDLTFHADSSQPTSEHLDQLRLLPYLREMAIGGLRSANLVYLLRTPHSLQWQQIYRVDLIGNESAAALSSLPTLTKLDTFLCSSVAFLPSLTRLLTLSLHMDDSLAADIVAGLSHCTQLTKLSLWADDVTSKHLGQALSHLPLLRSLSLYDCPALESLSFLSECACLTQSLESLRLSDCHNAALHLTELKHILTLKTLTSLDITGTFVEPLDADIQHLLTPPSAVLPKLKSFYCSPPDEDA